MKLTVEKTISLLNEMKKPDSQDYWINHSLRVGNCAGIIANALNENGYTLDVDKIKILGYLHDIGKYNGIAKGHIMRGYNYLKENGYDEDFCNICLTHSYLNNDIGCCAGSVNTGDNIFLKNFIKYHDYTLEEKIINLCDLMCTRDDKIVTIDKRLIIIILKRGVYSNTQYHINEAYKLKESFDHLLGYNLYDLFPEIKENL